MNKPPLGAQFLASVRALILPQYLLYLSKEALFQATLVLSVAWLLKEGASAQGIMVMFAIMYMTVPLVGYCIRFNVITTRQEQWLGVILLFILILCAALLCWAGTVSLQFLTPLLAAGFTLRTLASVKGLTEVQSQGEGKQSALLALALGFMPVSSATCIVLFGILADLDIRFLFGAIILPYSIICVRALMNTRRHSPDTASTGRAPIRETPGIAWGMFILGGLFNAVSMLRSRLIAPAYALIIAEGLGLAQHSLKVVGLIFGISLMVGVWKKSIKLRSSNALNSGFSQRLMLGGCSLAGLALVLWGLIDVVLVRAGGSFAILGYVLVVVMIIGRELSSMIWTFGFYEELRKCTLPYPEDERDKRDEANKLAYQMVNNSLILASFLASAVFMRRDIFSILGEVLILIGLLQMLFVGVFATLVRYGILQLPSSNGSSQ